MKIYCRIFSESNPRNKTISYTLFIILIFFSMSFNFSFSQITLKVNYLNNDGFSYEDVTTNVKVWISPDLKGRTKTLLNASDGVFKIDSLLSDCPYFHIKDQNGEMHIQKICMGLKTQKDWIVYIGSSDCLYHFEGYQPEPFIPSYDKLYITFAEGIYSKLINKLDTELRGGGALNLYEFNAEKRTAIMKELSKMEGVYTIAPIRLFTHSERSYFTTHIEILFKDSLTNQEITKLFKGFDINEINRFSPKHYTWTHYKIGTPYIITFKKGGMDYSLLNKLNEFLLKNENVLVIKTSATVTETKD